jgi:RHS repeat-associated protein
MIMMPPPARTPAQRLPPDSQFTGKERDETGLDYFGARYYSGSHGRFTSPDPILSSGRPNNPQTWNKYAYVLNNPILYIDPHGLYEFSACDGEECEEWKKIFNSGIGRAREALKAKKLTKTEKADLEEVLEYLGTAGDGNNVRIAFGDVEGAFGALMGKDQIKINMKALIAESKKDHIFFEFDLTAEVAGTAVHEGRHGKNNDQRFRINLGAINDSLATYGEIERRAFNSESFVFKGLGVSSIHGLWRTNWEREGLSTVDREKLRSIGVERSVERSVNKMRDGLNKRE